MKEKRWSQAPVSCLTGQKCFGQASRTIPGPNLSLNTQNHLLTFKFINHTIPFVKNYYILRVKKNAEKCKKRQKKRATCIGWTFRLPASRSLLSLFLWFLTWKKLKYSPSFDPPLIGVPSKKRNKKNATKKKM